MTPFSRSILTLAIIFTSLSLGYLSGHLAARKNSRISQAMLKTARRKAQNLAIFALIPISAMLSLWGLPRPEAGLLALPLLGLASYIWGGALALLAAAALGFSRKETGSFYCCGTFANIGAVGGLVCLMFLGENSIALVALYRLFEEMYYFGVTFPIARWYGENARIATLSFRAFRVNPVLGLIIAALSLGICLNLAGVARPDFLGGVASAAMFVATILFLFAIGLTLRLSSLFRYWKAGIAICAIKFIGAPLAITALAWGMGYGIYDNGLPLKVVAILSAMPVAMTALVPPALFNLDVDLANACWIFSTLGLIAVLPVLLPILPML